MRTQDRMIDGSVERGVLDEIVGLGARNSGFEMLSMVMDVTDERAASRMAGFEPFVDRVEPRLLQALVARLGAADGREATVDALSWAWENWTKVGDFDHPVAYLFRVGVTSARRFRSRRPSPYRADDAGQTVGESLSVRQRTVVVLVSAYQWRIREVAEHLDIAASTAQRHYTRGLARLYELLKDDQ
jgi:DNA-directed RNA polymerase specialized sigma24 family protein